MNIKSWQLPRLLKDLSLKRRDFLHPAADMNGSLVDICHVPCSESLMLRLQLHLLVGEAKKSR